MSANCFEENPFLEDDNPFLSGPSKPASSNPSTSRTRSSASTTIEDDNPFASKPSTSQKHAHVSEYQKPALGSAHYSDPFSEQATTSTFQPKHAYAPTASSLLSPGSSREPDTQQSCKSEQSSHKSRSSKSTELDYRNVGPDDLKLARRELKAWEANFKAAHQRDATQDDIAQDATMVKKYRAYSKLKKALAAKTSQDHSKAAASSETKGKETATISSRSRNKESKVDIMKTPTKPSRTYDVLGMRTPSKKHNPTVEYVSPRNIAGFMSPGRGSKTSEGQLQYASGSPYTTPKSQRTKNILFSPSRSTRRRSLAGSPGFRSPGSLFTIREQIREAKGESSNAVPTTPTHRNKDISSENPFMAGSHTSTRRAHTPTPKRISTAHTLDVFLSPARPRTSPLFGGMNVRRPKRAPKVSAPVKEDLEPQTESNNTLDREFTSTPQESPFSPPSVYPKSPLLSTPQKSGAAKAARSLFRRSSIPHTSLSSPYRSLNLGESFARAGSEDAGVPSPHAADVHEALDSMSISDVDEIRSPSTGRITHGFDAEDRDLEAYRSMQASPAFSRRFSQGFMSPTATRSPSQMSLPRTPSQQPSLTFSQPTPGSITPDAGLWVVPPGFHSHHQRRRQVRSSLFMPSQEEFAQFELEFNLRDNERQMSDVRYGNSNDAPKSKVPAVSVPEHSTDGNDGWEEQDGQVAVAPSEKAEAEAAKAAAAKASTRSRKTATAVPKAAKASKAAKAKAEDPASETVESNVVTSKDTPAAESAPTKTDTPTLSTTKKEKEQEQDQEQPFGWANSNKPMVKSDRRIPGVGQGRAGARKPSKFGAPASEGNFVAYNLQRGTGGKRGGFRGKSRFGGSKFGGFGGAAAGGPGTGRTLFDADSWRSEYDKDFDDNTLIMSLAGGDLEIEDEDDDMPWYGNVNDITDPYVVTISPRYLKARVGEEHDPEEYVKELELQNRSEVDGDLETDNSQGFRVNLEYILKRVWGYPSFRDGQLDSIKRTLRHESSLLVLPTGSGKSLSYQLPAYILSKLGIPTLTLVISPMISLMYDQVKCLPPGLIGACWTSVEQTTAQFKDFMEKLTANTIKILFISPEKLQSQSFLSLVRTKKIPPIPFVCVDEVHCLSEWSHNFRPAYLLLNHVLISDLKSPCVVGLTGTATEGTKDSICAMLNIDRSAGVLSGPVIRDNLAMTVSVEADREPALLNLLQSPRFAAMDAILIYVMRQAQADALAAFLRVRNFSAESYHAGKSSQDRQRIQHRFMNDSGPKAGAGASSQGGAPGGIRILVATIAFGLGLNKSNIRSVIHYCLPKSLENYIQEIGRSGRDGEKSYCHMFLNQDDYMRLRSLAYADGMDWGTVLRLIKKLFSRRDILDSMSLGAAGTAKRRRDLSGDADEIGADLDGDQDVAKKRKQNNQRALSVKGGKGESKVQSLVHSTAGILVIPPPSGLQSCPMSTSGKRVVVVREELVEEEYDIKKEVLATLLSYVELDDSHPIKVIGSISAKCTVKFLLEAEALSERADQVSLVDLILKHGVMTGHNVNGSSSFSYGRGRKGSSKSGLGGSSLSMAYCCDTVSLCQQSGLSFTELTQELQQWKRKKWALYEMTDPGLCVEILSEPADCMKEVRRRERGAMDVDMSEEEEETEEAYEKDHDDFIMMLADRLHRKLCAVERVGVAKVDRVYELFQSVATETWQQQEVFKPRLLGSGDDGDDDEEDEKDAGSGEDDGESGAESSEYEDDADLEYIEMRMKAKAAAKRRKSLAKTAGFGGSGSFKVTQAELVLREGIQEYFAKRSGEGIGGLHAEDELFSKAIGAPAAADEDDTSVSEPPGQPKTPKAVMRMDKTIRLYDYENELVTNMQRKWRSAVEVDLKVFLNQQWQQQQQSSLSAGGDVGLTTGSKVVDSPRVVCRIFHGISSPCFPIMEWRNHRYWGKYMHFDFAQMMQMAARITKEQRVQRLQHLQQR
ncbi:hypothetical protein K457DRAFT_20869 [Linnemannia elongata AG-77]|uniref:DNA 3'-5' helicase n=1 Tax=Linnemannia elongata AG-77 TaxID=1314771 RepID=A0A197JRF8_9FUNG|nr:hypothetical protein K457DRAFT_20869 [Linnemannia elongata AG-77]